MVDQQKRQCIFRRGIQRSVDLRDPEKQSCPGFRGGFDPRGSRRIRQKCRLARHGRVAGSGALRDASRTGQSRQIIHAAHRRGAFHLSGRDRGPFPGRSAACSTCGTVRCRAGAVPNTEFGTIPVLRSSTSCCIAPGTRNKKAPARGAFEVSSSPLRSQLVLSKLLPLRELE
jgi:hypothetical protein